MADRRDLRTRSSTLQDVPVIAEFLEPFVQARQLLRRSDGELQLLSRTGFLTIDAEHGDRFVGFAAIEIYSRKLAEVQCLAVHPGYRGLGIGRDLVGQCIELARERKVIELMAISSEESFLRDCGFDYSLPDQKRALFIRTHEGDIQ